MERVVQIKDILWRKSALRQEIMKVLLRPYKTLTLPQLVWEVGAPDNDLLLFAEALHELIEKRHVLVFGDRYMRVTLKKAEGF